MTPAQIFSNALALDERSWQTGRAAARIGAANVCPPGCDLLAFTSGYLEGQRERAGGPTAAGPRLAFGCGFVHGGGRCAVASCARTHPCTGLLAHDILPIGRGQPGEGPGAVRQQQRPGREG